MKTKLTIIVAMAQNRAIGKNNQLLWRLPEDLIRFKQITMGHPIIMGRKTHESIGRVLPGRKNIIITRQKNFRVPDAFIAVTKESALKHCEGAEQAFVIGGADIYRLFLPHTDRIYLTQIHETYPDADTYFPEIVAETFKEAQRDSSHLTNPDRNRENADTAGPPPRYSYITLERT